MITRRKFLGSTAAGLAGAVAAAKWLAAQEPAGTAPKTAWPTPNATPTTCGNCSA